jgi:hypothetical protein
LPAIDFGKVLQELRKDFGIVIALMLEEEIDINVGALV